MCRGNANTLMKLKTEENSRYNVENTAGLNHRYVITNKGKTESIPNGWK